MSSEGRGVLIMAGGTGGHIFPGLAVADCLRDRGVAVRWLGAAGAMECERVPAHRIPLDTVDIAGLRRRGAAGWLRMPWRLLRAVSQAFSLIGRRRPACAISFGGYAAGPGGLAARLRGIPLLVHEQNRIPGMTNRVLARLAQRVLQAFPGTWEPGLDPRTCGNPVRRAVADLEAPAVRLAGRSGPFRILVTGGSQGARTLNRAVPAALGLLKDEIDATVHHQAGRRETAETRQAYAGAGIGAEVAEFIDDMAAAYRWADLVVCRAGALTVSELAAAGAAAVLVPYPYAVDDHQTKNAEFLVGAGAAVLLAEKQCTPPLLAGLLRDLLESRSRLLEMAENARSVAIPDSAERVAEYCLEYAA